MGRRAGRRWLGHTHLDLLDYPDYLRLGEVVAGEVRSGRLPPTLLTTTHPPVVTLGRDSAAATQELRVPAAELARRGLALERVERGGRATYHGPGQLLVYPFVALERLGLGPVDLAGILLRSVARALTERWAVLGCEMDRGLWVRAAAGGGRAKLASIGLGARGGVTRHGLALNVEPEPGLGFAAVYPCGDPAARMTDLATLTGTRPDREALGASLARALAESLDLDVVPLAWEELLGRRPPWLVGRESWPAEGRGAAGAASADAPGSVCAAADCPNRKRCAAEGRVTYLLLGPTCTRTCAFCRVSSGGRPVPPDAEEPERVARAVARGTAGQARPAARRVVLTSVTRDDLPDGGAAHFGASVRALRRLAPGVECEVLVPDFGGREDALDAVLDAAPDALGHNLETVPGRYPSVRPGADYAASLGLLARAAAAGVPVRSGLLLGLGEDTAEVLDVLKDLARSGCRRLWLGQYLRPTPAHHPVARYATPGEFELLSTWARRLGFEEIAAGPLVRSSCSA